MTAIQWIAAISALLVAVVFGQLLFAEWAARGDTDQESAR